jgi:VanZ family protein
MLLRRLRHPLLLLTGALSATYLVFGLSPHMPAPLDHVSDIIVHGLAYAVLAVAAVTTAVAFGFPIRTAVVAGVAFASSHGALLELLQLFCPPRHAEVKDLLVDVCGAMAGAAPWWRLRGER